jgi:hypothetical protein
VLEYNIEWVVRRLSLAMSNVCTVEINSCYAHAMRDHPVLIILEATVHSMEDGVDAGALPAQVTNWPLTDQDSETNTLATHLPCLYAYFNPSFSQLRYLKWGTKRHYRFLL